MAIIRCMDFEKWGMDSFCIQDYNGYLQDLGYNFDTRNEQIATLTLSDEDDYLTLSSFAKLCRKSQGVALFVIEFAFIKDGEKAASYWKRIKSEVEEYGDYIDLESYETKLAFGLKGDRL